MAPFEVMPLVPKYSERVRTQVDILMGQKRLSFEKSRGIASGWRESKQWKAWVKTKAGQKFKESQERKVRKKLKRRQTIADFYGDEFAASWKKRKRKRK